MSLKKKKIKIKISMYNVLSSVFIQKYFILVLHNEFVTNIMCLKVNNKYINNARMKMHREI